MGKQKNKSPIKILVTGFGAFANHTENPCEKLVTDLEKIYKKSAGSIELKSLRLKTEFNSCYKETKNKIDSFHPDIVIAFGLSAAASGFKIESVARNKTQDKNNITGEKQRAGKINKSGKDSYKSTLPYKKINKTLNKSGINSAISKSAGDFVCNHLFYQLMYNNIATQSGFIHIPLHDDTALLKGAEVIIETIVSNTLSPSSG